VDFVLKGNIPLGGVEITGYIHPLLLAFLKEKNVLHSSHSPSEPNPNTSKFFLSEKKTKDNNVLYIRQLAVPI
jgi:hypothetical protein